MTTSSHGKRALDARRQHLDPVRLRELGAGEFDVLETVFDGLSPMSRFNRFHGATPRLSPLLRDRLGAIDGRRHIAVAAFAGREPIGIARLIDLGDGRAEMAVEVVDAWQGRGIGAQLVRAVAERGRAMGGTEIVADVLADNLAAQGLLASVFPALSSVEQGPEIIFTADLATIEPITTGAAA